MPQYVYHFSNEENNIPRDKKKEEILGVKGLGIVTMCEIGIPVPPGIIITTDVFRYFQKNNKLSNEIIKQIFNGTKYIEKRSGLLFDRVSNPLLLSVRSGAPISMPGMMDTILNIGFTDGFDDKSFSREISKRLTQNFLRVGINEIPEDINTQLLLGIESIIKSWDNPRAKKYRENIINVNSSLGTAVIIQQMVFGNYNDKSCSGVVFSKNPYTEKKEIYGEYVLHSQGEDIALGKKIPKYIENLINDIPEAHEEIIKIAKKFDSKFKDIVEFEFTVQNNTVYVLQYREEKELDKIYRYKIDKILEKKLNTLKIISKGIPSSPGIVSGVVCHTLKEVIKISNKGEKAILFRDELSPEDINSLNASVGIVTVKGGMTCHASVIARAMHKPCVAGCSKLEIVSGDLITIDGLNGIIYSGTI